MSRKSKTYSIDLRVVGVQAGSTVVLAPGKVLKKGTHIVLVSDSPSMGFGVDLPEGVVPEVGAKAVLRVWLPTPDQEADGGEDRPERVS